MKKIYTILFASCLAGISLSSCSDWLDVRPADEIKEEYLFETGNGYRTALNGIYRKLATFDLYGSNLSWGLIDGWGFVYDLSKASDRGGGKAMKKLAKFNYKNSELVPTTDAMWSAAWNIIANCNNLAQQVAEEDTTLFYKGKQEKNLILGEAIALRAYMHFDLLRIYAPSPAMNPGDRIFIPYVDKYPSYLADRQTVSYCLDHIIADLVEAQRILQDVDKSSEFTLVGRFTRSPGGEERFVRYRGYHLNYHAVTAALARVYLYAGQPEKAYEAAKLLIDINADKGYYKAVTSSYSGPQNIENGNIKMYEDIIFAIYSTDQTDWDMEANHASDNVTKPNDESYLAWNDAMVAKFFDSERDNDWRLKYQLGPNTSSFYRSLKYKKQDEGSSFGKENSTMVPMIRMSEVYYIAAEAIYDTDKELAKSYLKTVKQGRGIRTPDFSKSDTKQEFINLIVNDARREFFGEGQTFFLYKRLKRNLEGGDKRQFVEYPAIEDNMVLPLPDSESNI